MASPSPIVRYEKSEIIVMRRGDVVDRQESERVSDGKGSVISERIGDNGGCSTARVQLLPLGEDASYEPRAGGGSRRSGSTSSETKVRVPRLLDPLKLGALASTAYGAFLFASKRDARRMRAFWPRSPLVPAEDDGRVDPHLVALNALLGSAYIALGAAQGVMGLASAGGSRRLFHLWNAAQTVLNQLVVTRCRRRGFDDRQARTAASFSAAACCLANEGKGRLTAWRHVLMGCEVRAGRASHTTS